MKRILGMNLLLALAALIAPLGWNLPAAAAETALLKAARLNDLPAAKAALEKDPKEIDSRDDSECTPLHEGARYGDAQFVEYLLSKGAKVNSRCYNQFTPLHLTDDPGIAKLLLKAGADLQARDAFGRTPLGEAVDDENMELVDLYLAQGATLDFDQLVKLGRSKEVAAILKDKPWMAKAPRTCLHTAAGNGNFALVKLLLEHGADPNHSIDFSNASGVYSPFSSAVLSDHYEVAALLAERGAEMDVAGGKMYRSLFHNAIADHDVRFVKLMIQHGADVNGVPPGFNSMTPLHVAANIGDLEKCKLLLESGAKINAQTPDGATPILFAAVWNHKEVCDLLLSKGAKLDLWTACALGNLAEVKSFVASDPKLAKEADKRLGRPPLFWAVQRGEPELVEFLIKSGADVNARAPRYGQAGNVVTGPEVFGRAKDRNGESPLHLAAERGNLPILKQLLAAGANFDVSDEYNHTPLIRGIHAEHVEAVKLLLEQGALADNPQGEGSPLMAASNHLELTRILLAKKPSSESLQAALKSAAGENDAVSKELLSHGAKADLLTACTLGLDDRITELLKADATIINRPQTEYPRNRPLELAIREGHLSTAKLLIERGAQLEEKGEWSMLSCAAQNGRLEIAKLLLINTDLNCKDGMGQTPLHEAAGSIHIALVQLLLEKGANLKAEDVYGNTPLHDAARQGTVDVAKTLVAAGAAVDTRNKFRETPLHLAASEGNIAMTTYLLAQKADVNAKNRRGATPLAYAERPANRHFHEEEGDRKGVAQLLRAKGGEK